jgi:hypothetical protein
MTTIKAMVRNRRIDVPAPTDIPDGAEVTLTIVETDDGPLPQEEIARVLAAMQTLDSWNVPANVAADLDAWEHKINQHGIQHSDPGAEDVFR